MLTDDAAAGWIAVPVGVTDAGAGRAPGELTTAGVRISGAHEAKAACVVRLRFDNQHAWTRSKMVTYTAIVEAEPGPVTSAVDAGAATTPALAVAEPEPEPALVAA